MCYGRNKGFNHDHRTCPIHKADTEAYKKVHGSKKRAPAGIRETKVEVDKDELSKLMSVGTELAKEIQEIKRNWVPRLDNKNNPSDPFCTPLSVAVEQRLNPVEQHVAVQPPS